MDLDAQGNVVETVWQEGDTLTFGDQMFYLGAALCCARRLYCWVYGGRPGRKLNRGLRLGDGALAFLQPAGDPLPGQPAGGPGILEVEATGQTIDIQRLSGEIQAGEALALHGFKVTSSRRTPPQVTNSSLNKPLP